MKKQGWIESSFCNLGACLQLLKDGDIYTLRNSTNPFVEVEITSQEWETFVLGVKNGDFD